MYGGCKSREDFRLFKLNRMDELRISENVFDKRQVPMPDLSNAHIFSGDVRVKALFDADCKWRLVEEFGMDSFEEQMDGKLLFQADYSDAENLIQWLLTFGDKVVLLEPIEMREKIVDIAKNIQKRYL